MITKRPRYLFFISLAQEISFKAGALSDAPRIPRKSAVNVSKVIYNLQRQRLLAAKQRYLERTDICR